MSVETWTSDSEEGFPGFAAPRAGPRTVSGRHGRASAPVHVETPTAWLPLGLSVFTLLIFSRGWISLLVGPDADAESSAILRNLFIPAYIAAVVLALGDWRRSLRGAISGALPFLLVTLAFVSCLWSIAPDLTFRRSLALLFTTIAAAALASRLDWLGLARAVAGTFAILAVGSAVVAVALPHVGVMGAPFPGAWRGLWGDKNALGDYMALGVCACAGTAVLDRRLRAAWLAAAGLCLFLIILSTSKTSLVALAGGMAALALVALARRSPALAIGAMFGGGLLLVAGGVFVWLEPRFLLHVVGKDITLTGRTEIWTAVLRRIAERPATGFGYAVVWNDTSGWGPLAWIVKEARFTPHHAHNSWLEAELELGYAGVGLLALLALQAVARLMRANEGAWLAAPMLAGFGVITLTETVTMEYNDFMWVIIPALIIRMGLRDAAPGRASPPVPKPSQRPWVD